MPPKSVTSKPSRGRPKNSVTTCSLCKTVGHTKTTCPRRKVLSDEAELASLSSPIESIEPPHVLHSSSVSSNTKSCLFCCSPVSGFNVSGRPLLVCDSCTPIDPCRPPFAIPQIILIRSLTFSLRKGIWNPSIFWKFFLSKAMSSHKKSKYKKYLDFKNAFNSVKREAIFEVIKSDFPELSSFFYHFYGKESDLIFNSFGFKSSSGVKQGDPLGPLLFCLAIHKTLNIIKQKYPSIKIVAYMDAALSSDVFFNSSDSNYIFNLDFKNAFNSVSRSSILPLLQKHFPEVESFFYSFYGKSSTLVYENFDLLSSSGVKQGDPLGPFFFCLAIHPLMCELKEKFPEIDIVAYMDDISVIAPITILKQIATFIQQRYEDIGLSLNISKCLIIGHEPIDFFINDVNVPFINYDQSGFRFLGCYLGNIDEVKSQLSTLLTQFGNELESIENLNIEKHLKFFFLKICYSGKFTHILRSTSPSISLEFCRIFNEQRTNFLAKLLEIDASQLRSHIFCGTNFGGVDFHKSSYLCKAAFIGGGKNFIYEFVNRFPEKIHLIENCGSSYLISLQQEIETLSPNIWAKCFPSDIVELPSRSLLSLPLTFAKLQKKILKVLENLDYIVRLSLAKEKNPVLQTF
ncbi:hypothetical protein P9112_003744 [Eukaryota sp. TZLM1-RC]